VHVQVYYDTGAKYILGLTFETGDIELARNQMNKAKRMLPGESIISFEIGNEVSFRCFEHIPSHSFLPVAALSVLL
jgi:hypothetical protein